MLRILFAAFLGLNTDGIMAAEMTDQQDGKAELTVVYPMLWQMQLRNFQSTWVAQLSPEIDPVVTGSFTHRDREH